MDGLRLIGVLWALFAMPAGLLESYVRLTTWSQAEMTCAQYIESGFKPRWVKLSDCDTRGRAPIYFSRGGSAGGPTPRQFIPVYAPGSDARAFVYSFHASLGSLTPFPVAGLRQAGLLGAFTLKEERAKLRERYALPENFVIVNAGRGPSAPRALGLLLSAALGLAFAAYPHLRRG